MAFHPETRHPRAVTPGGTRATLRPGVCLGGARIRVPSVGKPGHTPGNVKLLLPPRQSRGNSQCIRSRDVGHAECAASWTATDGWGPARVFWRSSLGRSAWAAADLSTPHRVRPGAVSSCDRTRAGRACATGTGFDTRIGARTHKGRGTQRMAATARSPAWTPRPTQPPRQGRAVVNETHAVPHSSQRHRQASD